MSVLDCIHEREVWKWVPGYEGFYKVSNIGRVKSISRQVLRVRQGRVNHMFTIPEKILKPGSRSGRELFVYLCQEGVNTPFAIHRLVLLAFVGPCPNGMEGCHNDGNRRNNRLDNLRWDTHKNNQHDMYSHGTAKIFRSGEDHLKAKLTWCEVREIRHLYSTGEYTCKKLARRFEVCLQSICNIVLGKTWKE